MIVARRWTLYESHLLRLYLGVCQPSVASILCLQGTLNLAYATLHRTTRTPKLKVLIMYQLELQTTKNDDAL